MIAPASNMTPASKLVFFLVLLLFSTMIPVVRGLYLYDVVIIGVVLTVILSGCGVNRFFLRYFLLVLVLIFTPSFLGVMFQVLSGYNFSLESVYILYNSSLSLVYILYVQGLDRDWLIRNIGVITMFLMVPIFISLLMYLPTSIADYLHSFYGVERLTGARFGGVWGKNVNQLGYIASTMLIWVSFIYSRRLVGCTFSLFIFVTCMFAIFLSGMRSGLVMFFITILLSSLFYRESRLIICELLVLFLLAFVVASFLFGGDFLSFSIFKRFSIELFISQLTGVSGDGHVGNMYGKWFTIFFSETDFSKILFSFYPEWKYPDSLVIYYFANAGLFGVFTLLFFAIFSLYSLFKLKSFSLLLVFLFSVGMAFKGNFLFNNMSMLLFTLMFFVDRMELDTREE